MFYSKEMIKNMGYESIDDFVHDYVKKYKNCCVRFHPNGVYLDYDFDSQVGIENIGYNT